MNPPNQTNSGNQLIDQNEFSQLGGTSLGVTPESGGRQAYSAGGNIYYRNELNTGTPQYSVNYEKVNNSSNNNTNLTNPVDSQNLPTGQDKIDLSSTQDAYQKEAKRVEDTITGIQNGTIPLSSGELAQVEGLKQQFQQLIDQQKTINTGAEGTANIRGYQTGAAEYDPTFQTKTIGSIVTAGLNKVSDLNVKMASAVAALTQSFKNEDIASVKDAWNIYSDASKERQNAIQKTIDDTQKQIKEFQDQQQKITDNVNAIALEAKKNGADTKTTNLITGAKSVSEAMANAGDYLQSASGNLGEYLQYKHETQQNGLTPMLFEQWKDKQDAKQAKADAAKAYATAYASAAGKAAADNNSGVNNKEQQKLEQQGRQVLTKEFSARTGALGVENAKVNQANHLNSLFQQYLDPKTGKYNIPKTQYSEIALGLANLLAPTGQASDSLRESIITRTLKGDINGALSYATGTPYTGSTQGVFKNLLDSIDRQAETAVRNRESALQNMRDLLPTDLEESRKTSLLKGTEMVKYEGADRLAKAQVDDYVKSNPKLAEPIAKLYEVPGVTNQDILDYINLNHQ